MKINKIFFYICCQMSRYEVAGKNWKPMEPVDKFFFQGRVGMGNRNCGDGALGMGEKRTFLAERKEKCVKFCRFADALFLYVIV